jgi:hypothetical protein
MTRAARPYSARCRSRSRWSGWTPSGRTGSLPRAITWEEPGPVLDEERQRVDPIEQNPNYRQAMKDAGRGHLLP